MKNAYEGYDDFDSEYSTSGYDITDYPEYLQSELWPTITPVIPFSQFIRYIEDVNCLTLAKRQIAVKGYQISGYSAPGQTYNINTSEGVNVTEAKKAAGYIKSALQAGIPVIVGIDYMPGVPANRNGTPANPDLKTDHFVVIVGMGIDAAGKKFFHFYDSATQVINHGVSSNNKLYYEDSTGIIKGTTEAAFATNTSQYRNSNGKVIYTLTHVRKSKLQ